MKSIVPLLTTIALAASSVSGASSSSSNPLIPSGISSSCQAFLNDLNTDSAMAACTRPLVSLTSAFGPNGNVSSTPSSATISKALDALSSSNFANDCPKSMFSSKLASFAQACPTELVGTPITDIIRLYDTVYMMIPFRNAVCSKDDSGRYCATEPAASSSASGSQPSPSGVVKGINQKYLWDTVSSAPISRRDLVASVPNITTFAALNIAFLLLQPNLSASALCTTCTRNIITSYISFETDVPHACGIAQSTLLVGQTELYKAIQSKCGTNFLSGAVEAAGGIAGGLLSGAPRSTGDFNAAIVAVMLGIVGLGFTVVL